VAARPASRAAATGSSTFPGLTYNGGITRKDRAVAVIKLIGFAGEAPKVIPRLLGDTFAQAAYNTRLDDGGLTPIRRQRFVQQLADAPPEGFGTIYLHNGVWLAWPGHVYAAPGPVASDRLYVMGDGAPKMIAGGVTYDLAIQPPASALSAAVSGTPSSGLGSTRLYVYTWVTDFGEESEPCPVSNEVYWEPGQTVTLSGFTAAPSGRAITKQRIYRSQTSTTGTQLYFIAERAVSTDDFIDNIPSESIQEPLPSLDWNAPPDDLTGLAPGPNGMMAAFRGKEVYFCEPYRPHAWPEKYVLTTDYPVVGLAWFGASLAILTTGVPYIASGSAPENMVMEKTALNLPCINARGIVDLGYSVVYPSHDGLVQVSSSGTGVVTAGLFSRDDWLRLNPQGMVAGQYNGRYLTSYSYADANGEEHNGTFIIDLTGSQPFLIRSDVRARAMYYDIPSGVLYMLIGDRVYEWDAMSEPFELQSWKSKLFVLPTPTNFGAILVESDDGLTDEEIAAIEAEAARVQTENDVLFAGASIGGELGASVLNEYPVNGDMLLPIPTINRHVSVSVYADRKLVATIGKVNRMARLPSGFKADKWEIEVTSDMPITQILMATTGMELAGA